MSEEKREYLEEEVENKNILKILERVEGKKKRERW